MRRITVVFVFAALALAVPAHAQDGGGLIVSPFHVEEVLSSRSFEQALTYRNDGGEALDIKVRVRRLGHDLDGAPRHLRSETHQRAFSIDVARFTLQPGTTKRVNLKGAIPDDERSMYLGVIAEFDKGSGAGSAVTVRSQVATQFLLRGPRPWRERVRVTDVGVAPGENGTVTVYAVAENTGDVHARPKGVLEIRKNGRTIGRVRLGRPRSDPAKQPPAIIPGFSRRLVGTWDPPTELSGRVGLVARLSHPKATGSGIALFGSDAEAPPAVSITSLKADPQEGGIVTVQLSNDGGEPVRDVAVSIIAKQGETERARIVLPARTLRTGLASPQTWQPGLPDGTYLITAAAMKSDSVLDERVADLVIGRSPDDVSPSARSKAPLAIAAAALVLVMAGVVTAFTRARRA